MTNDQTNMDGTFSTFEDQAHMFLLGVMNHYRGTPEQKIKRSVEFLDDLLFFTENDLGNPFSPESRNVYRVAYYSRNILIPKILEDLKTQQDSNPFPINDWN
ncbi:MAG: hypothetical protein MK217_06720 [Gammaproteobacteria bacterium]|nr:hypothetical protein [Gammaproteobacteria bacterium]